MTARRHEKKGGVRAFAKRGRKRVARACAVLALAIAAWACEGGALDSVPPGYMDVLDPDYFFRARNLDLDVRFSRVRKAVIQGIATSCPEPDDMRVRIGERAGISYVMIDKDGTTLVECAFQARNPQPQAENGEPFNSMKKSIQVELLKNIIIRGAAGNCGDAENLLPNMPVIILAQNTQRAMMLEAREPSFEREKTKKGTAGAVFEGCVLLSGFSVPVSAIAHENPHGVDAGEVFLAWFDRFLRENAE